MTRVATVVNVRAYSDGDEPGVLQLLNAALGEGPAGERSAEFFRWKHRDNPFGRSFMLVAESDDRIVGLRAFMRWEFVARGRRFRAVRAVDTATHPEYQGQGIFSRLTLEALDALRADADFVFNTPNEKSLPGYLKMGWRVVGQVPIYVRVRRPLRFARHARSWKRTNTTATDHKIAAMPAGEALAAPGLEELLPSSEQLPGMSTARTAAYLGWRYADAPLLDYRATLWHEAGEVRSMAFFRVRPRGALREATVSDLLTRVGDTRAARHVLARVAPAAHVDHVACSFPNGSPALSAARRSGFVRVPGGMMLVTNALGHDLDPDPLDLAEWSLSVGDLEVF